MNPTEMMARYGKNLGVASSTVDSSSPKLKPSAIGLACAWTRFMRPHRKLPAPPRDASFDWRARANASLLTTFFGSVPVSTLAIA